jgi:hypothetical protein
MTMVGTWFGGFQLLISENQTKMRFDFWNWFKNWKHSFWWGLGLFGKPGARTEIKFIF